jgi:hypothetical protein
MLVAKKEAHQRIGLRELIDIVKAELAEKADGVPLFLVDKVEVEISFTVERDLNGGINLQVIETSAAKHQSDAHKVTVFLTGLATLEEARARLSAAEQQRIQQMLQQQQPQDDNEWREKHRQETGLPPQQ